MKKILTVCAITASVTLFAQDFDKSMADAKSAYASGDLENARFAMEQMLRDLDMAIGQEILKLLPVKLGAMDHNGQQDNVTGSGAGTGTGLFVQRSYANEASHARIDIINNSPLINSINAILAVPFVGNSSDGTQKVVKVQGYKAVLNRHDNAETGKTGYTLQVPLNNTLFTLEVSEGTENEILQMANLVPLGQIVELAQ